MRKLFCLLIVVFFIIGCTGCTKPPKLMISAKLSFLSGDVTILRKGKTQEAKLNMKLYPEDVIQTGKDSEVNILFANIGISKIKQNTELVIKELWKLAEGDQVRMDISKGKILSTLKKLTREKGESRFEIYTPTAVVGVRGTTFLVNVAPKKYTKVAVFAGEVEVAGRAETEKVANREVEGKAETEKIVIVEELKEAILPQSDFKKIRIVVMSDETFKEIESLEEIREIEEYKEEYKLEEIKEEIRESREKFQQLKEQAAILKKAGATKPAAKKPEDQKIKW